MTTITQKFCPLHGDPLFNKNQAAQNFLEVLNPKSHDVQLS